jgi:hypothetical protein
MHVETQISFRLVLSQQELTLVGRGLAGKLKAGEMRAAAELNLNLVEQVERSHRERTQVLESASRRANEALDNCPADPLADAP